MGDAAIKESRKAQAEADSAMRAAAKQAEKARATEDRIANTANPTKPTVKKVKKVKKEKAKKKALLTVTACIAPVDDAPTVDELAAAAQ